MLTDYKGSANSREIFKHLVSENITAMFQDHDGHIVMIVGSGDAIVFAGGVGGGSPSYWKIQKDEVDKIVEKRRKEIEEHLAQLKDLPGIY